MVCDEEDGLLVVFPIQIGLEEHFDLLETK